VKTNYITADSLLESACASGKVNPMMYSAWDRNSNVPDVNTLPPNFILAA